MFNFRAKLLCIPDIQIYVQTYIQLYINIYYLPFLIKCEVYLIKKSIKYIFFFRFVIINGLIQDNKLWKIIPIPIINIISEDVYFRTVFALKLNVKRVKFIQKWVYFRALVTFVFCCCFYMLILFIVLPIQKRFYTRGTLRSIRISGLAKITTLYRDWLKSLMKKSGLEFHRRVGYYGGWFERHSL